MNQSASELPIHTYWLPVDDLGRLYLTPGMTSHPVLPENLADLKLTVAAGHPEVPVMQAVDALHSVRIQALLVTVERPPSPSGRMPPLLLREAVKLIQDGVIDDLITMAALLRLEQQHLIRERCEILYRDQYCVAVYKPAGMLVHRTSADQERENLLALLRDQLGCRVQPVHRLDKPTSGIVLFALEAASTAQFYALFQEREIEKIYVALVRGFTEASGVIDYPVKDDSGRELPAVTEYETLSTVELPMPVGPYATARYSLVKVRLQTGRMHQIRKHFAHLRHPVIGDTKYGDAQHNRLYREQFHCYRLMLSAVRMNFRHPVTGQDVRIAAPPDWSFGNALEQIGLLSSLQREFDEDGGLNNQATRDKF